MSSRESSITVGGDVVFLVDASNSMCERIHGLRKLDWAVRAAKKFAEALCGRARVERFTMVYVFPGEVDLVEEAAPPSHGCDPAVFDLLMVDRCRPGTPSYQALRRAVEEGESGSLIVYVGDGGSTEPVDMRAHEERLLRRTLHDRRVVVTGLLVGAAGGDRLGQVIARLGVRPARLLPYMLRSRRLVERELERLLGRLELHYSLSRAV